jgi:hypothetical protein
MDKRHCVEHNKLVCFECDTLFEELICAIYQELIHEYNHPTSVIVAFRQAEDSVYGNISVETINYSNQQRIDFADKLYRQYITQENEK